MPNTPSIITAKELPYVEPMRIREVTPKGNTWLFGGCIAMDKYSIKDVGYAEKRLDFDEDKIDCSHRIFEITNWIIMEHFEGWLTVFPSRRWRNLRNGNQILALPNGEQTLMYLGNPVRIFSNEKNVVHIERDPGFIIKSGCQIQSELG